jgi:glycosyltransferase involved in cell wall biosynthesis
MKTKNIDKLLSLVENVRNKGLDISIVLTGKLVDVSLPEWAVQKQVEDWNSYVRDYLEKSDVCVIPYPSKLFWNLTLLAKLFDYMAAGKPIISTNLKEKGNIIKTFNCGLIAKDWKEFEQHIERLYQDRELAIKLGENGRKAAERYFDYEMLAKNFLATLIEMFRESG